MKRIVYIGNDLSSPGSLPTGITALSANLRREGYEVITASSKRRKPARLGEMLWTVWKYRKWADFVLIDTYSTWNFWYAYAVALLCRRLGLRYIPILHGGDLPGRLLRSPKASRVIFEGAYVNVAPSGFLVEAFASHSSCTDRSRPVPGEVDDLWESDLLGRGGQVATCPYINNDNDAALRQAQGDRGNSEFRIHNSELDRVVFIPNSINIAEYAFRRRRSVFPKLLWVRAFQGIYNPILALKALQELLSEYPEAELCMVGPVKEETAWRECREYAEEHGLPVKFPGKLEKSEWTALAQEYDVFINTTNVDNTPLSVVEAMALGLPVVSTEVGGLPYLIDDGEEGLLVPPNDPKAMARALERLLEEPDLAERLSLQARKKVEEFDWERVKLRWKKVFNSTN